MNAFVGYNWFLVIRTKSEGLVDVATDGGEGT